MAYVLSSVSGNLISAASAGFAPTNSADVSAIASSYQVVSATATQLYAGTAYVTSVNDNPISASRAGQAANASMANSAYYDGTGRLISALPDEATVSAIASAYADSAASGKLDKTAQVVTSIGTGWNSDDDEIVSAVNGCILSADEARYAGAADRSNYARYDRRPNVTGYRSISSLPGSAEVSAIASSYAESAASSKLDSTASSQFLTAVPDGYATTEYVDSSISGFAYESAVSGWTAKQDALTFGYDADDKISSIDGSAIAGGEQVVTSLQYTTSQSGAIIGYTTGDRAGNTEKVFSARYYPDKGWYNYQSATALASVGFTSLDSNITEEIEYPFEIFMIPYGTTNYGNINYISSVDSYMSNYGLFNNTSDFRIATGMATMSGYSAILDFNVTSLPFNTQYGPPMWGTAGGMVLDESENSKPVFTVVYGSGSDREGRCARIVDGPKALGFGAITTVSAVSGINELGIAGGGGGGIDSATCSAIASAYAESAVSSVSGNYVPYSSLEYNTASAISGINGSALAAGSTYSAGEGIDITDDVISVETPVDIVAGPGIVIDNPDGNTLRVSTDENYETVLWSGEALTGITLSESLTNFEQIKVVYTEGAGSTRIGSFTTEHFDASHLAGVGGGYYWEDTSEYPMHVHGINLSISGNAVSVVTAIAQCFSVTNNAFVKWDIGASFRLLKIVGVHRIANN